MASIILQLGDGHAAGHARRARDGSAPGPTPATIGRPGSGGTACWFLGLLAVPVDHRGAGLGGVEQLHQAWPARPCLALVLLQGGAGGGRVTAALLGIAGLVGAVMVFALMLRSEEQARRFGLLAGRVASRALRLVRRPSVQGWELATVKFRARTLDLVEHRWWSITVASLVSHLSLYLVLLVALRDVGVSDDEVGWAEVLAAFAFARLATAIPSTPGGVGFVEAVLITTLSAAGGDRDQVVAGVLVYRALTLVLPILVGVVCYLWWRRSSIRPAPLTVGPPVSAPTTVKASGTDQYADEHWLAAGPRAHRHLATYCGWCWARGSLLSGR